MRILRSVLVMASFVLGASAVAAQQAAPLVLEGDSALAYDAQEYFDLPREGTIEVWVAALWEADPGYAPCVLSSASASPSSGGGGGTHYGVYITPDRQAVGLYDGQRLATVAFDFTDGAYHHVALVTKGPRTQVIIDGNPAGTINLGYGKARGQPFSVGSSNGEADLFIGAVWALRIWNRALTRVALEELSQNVGPPPGEHPFASALVAHSNFTDAGSDITIPALAAAAASAPAEEVPPEEDAPPMEAGPDFSGTWVVRNSRVFEKDELDDVDGDKHWKFVTYPVYIIETGDGKAASRATDLVGARGGREFSDTVPKGGALAEIAIGSSDKGIDHVKVSGRNERGSALNFRRHGGQTTGTRVETFRLEEGETIKRITGTHDRQIRQIQFHTNKRSSKLFGEEAGAESYTISLPQGGVFAGISGRAARGLHAIGLQYQAELPSLVVIGDDGSRREFEPTGGDRWRSGGTDLVWEREGVFAIGDVRYERVPEYTTSEEKGVYEDVFIISNQLYNVDLSFKGYDVPRLDPWDYKASGVKDWIFSFPTGDSTEWYVKNRAIVPNGVEYVVVDSGGSEARTSVHTNERSYQEALKRNISMQDFGAFIPVGRIAKTVGAFQWNETFRDAVKEMYEEEKTKTWGEAFVVVYALVLDKARVKLDERFRSRVRELAETRDYDDFIAAYGTHYPHSIAYGGRGIHEMTMDRNTYSRLASQQVDFQKNATATLASTLMRGTTPGFQDFYSTDNTIDDEFKRAMSDQLDTFKWVGGIGGFSKETWQVGDKVTPVYLDLRLIDELLAPPHFTDPEITQTVRKGLADAVVKYLASVPPLSEKSVQPDVYEIIVEKIECVKSGEADRILELFGRIEVAGFQKKGRKPIASAEQTTLAWERGPKDPVDCVDTNYYNLQSGQRDGQHHRHVFAVSADDVAAGAYVQVIGPARRIGCESRRRRGADHGRGQRRPRDQAEPEAEVQLDEDRSGEDGRSAVPRIRMQFGLCGSAHPLPCDEARVAAARAWPVLPRSALFQRSPRATRTGGVARRPCDAPRRHARRRAPHGWRRGRLHRRHRRPSALPGARGCRARLRTRRSRPTAPAARTTPASRTSTKRSAWRANRAPTSHGPGGRNKCRGSGRGAPPHRAAPPSVCPNGRGSALRWRYRTTRRVRRLVRR